MHAYHPPRHGIPFHRCSYRGNTEEPRKPLVHPKIDRDALHTNKKAVGDAPESTKVIALPRSRLSSAGPAPSPRKSQPNAMVSQTSIMVVVNEGEVHACDIEPKMASILKLISLKPCKQRVIPPANWCTCRPESYRWDT